MQRGAADIVANRIHLRWTAVADDGHTVLRVLGCNGPGQQQIGSRLRRIGRVLSAGIGGGDSEQVGRNYALNIESGALRARGAAGEDWLRGFDRTAAQQRN